MNPGRGASVNYEFVHRGMRDFAFQKPELLLGMFSAAEGRAALARIWNNVAQALGEESRVEAGDFESRVRTWPDGTRAGVLRVPEASQMCDVILAGLVLCPGGRRLFGLPAAARPRFFTLEYTVRFGGGGETPGNVLCEWKAEEKGCSHLNYDFEVRPENPDAFEEAVGRVVRGEAPPA